MGSTSIVLIAFVVVSAVFAFASLSTGLFSADKSKDTIQAGLAEARGTLEVKGSVEIEASVDSGKTGITTIDASLGTFDLDFTPVLVGSETITSGGSPLVLGADYTLNYDNGRLTLTAVSSTDPTAAYTAYTADAVVFNLGNSAGGQAVDLTPGETIVVYQDDDTAPTTITSFGVTRLGSANRDNLLEEGEIFKISVDTKTFGLTDEDAFTIQVKPPTGAVVLLGRTVPTKIETIMFLK